MITSEKMGQILAGDTVFRYRLQNVAGAYADISTLGGCLLAIHVPDRTGTLGDVTLGYETADALEKAGGYMGFLIGRYGNRIGGAAFELNGKKYPLFNNDGDNHLHGGKAGFDKKLWRADVSGETLLLSLVSPDGDEGYPGTLSVTVAYEFTDDNTLRIHYQAATDVDTVLNLTNHVYFNLSGPSYLTLSGQKMQIHADTFCEVSDGACIPTGRLAPLAGTKLDLREPTDIADGLAHTDEDVQMRCGGGYDHNYVIRGWDGSLRQAANVTDARTGRKMEVWTDQPGIQFYSGNMIPSDMPGKGGVPYIKRQGFCLETQHFPDTPHHPRFPSCVLKKGEQYDTTTEYRFSIGE